jgi:hypothetical protein
MKHVRIMAASLALATAVACSDSSAPVDPVLSAPTEAVSDRGWNDGPIKYLPPVYQSTALVPGCERQGCPSIDLGKTRLVGWLAAGAGEAASQMRGVGSLSFIILSDTIPAPPAPLSPRTLEGEDAAQYMEVLSLAGFLEDPSDTIPGPLPPQPMVLTKDGNALFLLWTSDLVAKRVIRPNDVDGFDMSLLWETGSGRASRWAFLASGFFPPSDTIPGPIQ